MTDDHTPILSSLSPAEIARWWTQGGYRTRQAIDGYLAHRHDQQHRDQDDDQWEGDRLGHEPERDRGGVWLGDPDQRPW